MTLNPVAQAEANSLAGIERSFIYMPQSFNGTYYLTGIQSAYGNVVNSENVTYAIRTVAANGAEETITTWTHGGGAKHTSVAVPANDQWQDKSIYITIIDGPAAGSGFSVTLTFTNGGCLIL